MGTGASLDWSRVRAEQTEPCLPPEQVQQWMELDRPFFEAELRAAGAVERAEDVGVLAETCLLGEASTPEAQWVEGYTTMFGGPVAARTLPGTHTTASQGCKALVSWCWLLCAWRGMAADRAGRRRPTSGMW